MESKLFCRVKDIVSKQATKRVLSQSETIALRLLRLQEEVGEASRAYRNVCNDKDNYRQVRDDLIEESVDCVISSFALLAASAFEPFDFSKDDKVMAIFERKLSKWEANINKECD